MKTTDHFKRTIQMYLEQRAAEDALFAKNYRNPAGKEQYECMLCDSKRPTYCVSQKYPCNSRKSTEETSSNVKSALKNTRCTLIP